MRGQRAGVRLVLNLVSWTKLEAFVLRAVEGLPWWSVLKSPPCNVGDAGLSPCSGSSHMLQSNYRACTPQLESVLQ